MTRVTLAAFLLGFTVAGEVRADIILSAEALNKALKNMQRLQKQMASGAPRERTEARFQLGVVCDALATLLNDEVESHGMQEKALIDLALARTKELGVIITYNGEKRKFFYEGAAFRQYLETAPKGVHAAEASFWLIESEFYQSSATDAVAVLAASERKQAFLRRYPKFSLNAEATMFLAIDYRDLYRLYAAAGDAAKRDRFRELTRTVLRSIPRRYPGTEQAKTAEEMLSRFEVEARR